MLAHSKATSRVNGKDETRLQENVKDPIGGTSRELQRFYLNTKVESAEILLKYQTLLKESLQLYSNVNGNFYPG